MISVNILFGKLEIIVKKVIFTERGSKFGKMVGGSLSGKVAPNVIKSTKMETISPKIGENYLE